MRFCEGVVEHMQPRSPRDTPMWMALFVRSISSLYGRVHRPLRGAIITTVLR